MTVRSAVRFFFVLTIMILQLIFFCQIFFPHPAKQLLCMNSILVINVAHTAKHRQSIATAKKYFEQPCSKNYLLLLHHPCVKLGRFVYWDEWSELQLNILVIRATCSDGSYQVLETRVLTFESWMCHGEMVLRRQVEHGFFGVHYLPRIS